MRRTNWLYDLDLMRFPVGATAAKRRTLGPAGRLGSIGQLQSGQRASCDFGNWDVLHR